MNSIFFVLTRFAMRALVMHARTPLELLWRPFFKGPAMVTLAGSASAQQYAGRTAINSGTASATVSTAQVNSDSIIGLATQISSTSISSGSPFATFVVNSVVSGVSFALVCQDGIARAVNATVMWEIRRTS